MNEYIENTVKEFNWLDEDYLIEKIPDVKNETPVEEDIIYDGPNEVKN